MKVAIATLKGISPYSQSRHYDVAKLNDKENYKDYEARTWRNRCHTNQEGNIFIPPMAFKNCLTDAAMFLSEKIPGKRNATYTKHFMAGLLVMDPLVLPIKQADVQGEWLFVPSDGKRGGGSRVDKCFPIIHSWEGDVKFYILDDTITEDIFRKHLKEAGSFIGVGRFRPRNGGFYGRFKVESVAWTEGMEEDSEAA